MNSHSGYRYPTGTNWRHMVCSIINVLSSVYIDTFPCRIKLLNFIYFKLYRITVTFTSVSFFAQYDKVTSMTSSPNSRSDPGSHDNQPNSQIISIDSLSWISLIDRGQGSKYYWIKKFWTIIEIRETNSLLNHWKFQGRPILKWKYKPFIIFYFLKVLPVFVTRPSKT